jgi:N6-L-threonylcarbamoyladenine synthase
MIKILTLESTCDETAAAVVTDDLQVLGSVVASQETLHSRFRGVVPEVAARQHVQALIPVMELTLEKAGVTLQDLDAIAVANSPGLAGSLLVGLCAAKALAWTCDLPLIAINHLHAHVYACRIAARREVFPCVGLIVSGGHSNFYRCDDALTFDYLGGTIDDAAGEAFDKVAAMLGLGFPGGPAIAQAAQAGNPQAFDFPRPFTHRGDPLKFSFSGLKTAVRYALYGQGKPSLDPHQLAPQVIADVAASFQQAAVDCLVSKCCQAIDMTGLPTLCVGGGVAANTLFRQQLAAAMQKQGTQVWLAPPELCTDNAVMGAIAIEKYRAGRFESLELDIHAGLERYSPSVAAETLRKSNS